MTVCMLMRNMCNIWNKKIGKPVYVNPKLSDKYMNDWFINKMSKNEKNQKLTAYESYKKIESEVRF